MLRKGYLLRQAKKFYPAPARSASGAGAV